MIPAYMGLIKQADDQLGRDTVQSFKISVINVNDAPVMLSRPEITAIEDDR